MDHRFDDLSRILASKLPRREVIRLLVGGLGASYLARLWPGAALAQELDDGWDEDVNDLSSRASGRRPTRRLCGSDTRPGGPECPTPPNPTRPRCCPEEFHCCPGGSNPFCCPEEFHCCTIRGRNAFCCPDGHSCCQRECCFLDEQCCCSVGNRMRCRPRPEARLRNRNAGEIEIEVLDGTGNGIASIAAKELDNATTNPSLPLSYPLPGPETVTITATKIDPSLPSRVILEVCSHCSAILCCRLVDPVIATLQIPVGRRRVAETFTDLLAAERFVTLQNGDPGVRRVRVVVNGRLSASRWLRDGSFRVIDIGAEMVLPQNIVTIVADGQPGSTVLVVIGDAAGTEPAESQSGLLWEVGPVEPGQNLHWGR